MFRDHTVGVIIPALNEEDAIPEVVRAIDRSVADWVVVVDNGSTDETAKSAETAGAAVLVESRRGYGSACLRALNDGPAADIYVFLDGDGSDDPEELERILDPLKDDDVDIVIGSRTRGVSEPGALTFVQRCGNALTCSLVRLFWGVTYTDLGPFRAVKNRCLSVLNMSDPDFGWTIEMQVKAARLGLRVVEIPVRYRNRRAGKSKVSGTIMGSFQAGWRILAYVFRAKLSELFGI